MADSDNENGQTEINRNDPPGIDPPRIPEELENGDVFPDGTQLILEKQADAIRAVKTDARGALRIQGVVVGVIAGTLGVAGDRLEFGGFFLPESILELVGAMAILLAGIVLFGVFVFVPRPFTSRATPLKHLPLPPRIGKFRYPAKAGEVAHCLAWNEWVIDQSERRLHRIQWLNVLGFLFLLLWLGIQVLAG